MTSTAEVGNLRVSLFADTAQFAAGLALAQSSLGKFGETAKQFSDKVLEFFAFDHIRDTIAETVHQMDELGKTAQKIGIPVDQLSKLEYAAKLSEVSVEDLTTTLTKFSKSLSQIAAGGKNDAGIALKALGVAATDAQGHLRPTSAILSDVSDKFAGMKDGAGKTAIALALLGKTGAQLIPMLNGGSEALKEAADQASIFGLAVSEEASKAAEHFNDNLTRLSGAYDGIKIAVTTGLLPALNNLSDILVTLAENSHFSEDATSGLAGILKEASIAAATTYQEFYALSQIASVMAENFSKSDGFDNAVARWQTAFANIRQQAADTEAVIAKIRNGDIASGSSSSQSVNEAGKGDKGGKQDAPVLKTLAQVQQALVEAQKAADEADKHIANLFDEGKSLTEQFDPIAKYQDDLSHLNEVYNSGAISSATYQKALAQLREQFAQTAPQVDQFAEAFVSLSENFATTFGDAFAGVISGTESLKQAFASMAQSISQQLVQLAAQLAASAFIKLLGIVLGGGTSPSQSTWVNNLGSLFGGGKASGGPVSAGTTYLVGENGPELFTPGMSGGITPNSKMGGGGINVTVINNSSASVNAKKGADGSLKVFVEETMADLVLRGGNKVDAALARGYNLRRAGR